jgi:dipeptidyl aminopeptidase/acylaminoacyl peptidase
MGEPANNSLKAPNDPSDGRLDSWKEIAVYLGKSVRTVQRWEKEEALPIHRHAHSDRDSVYAFKPEVDVWRASRSHLLEGHNGHVEVNGTRDSQTGVRDTGTREASSAPVARPWRSRWWLVAVLAGALALAATSLAVFFTRSAPTAQILNYTQITHDGRWKFGLATDGVWVYFLERGENGSELCKVSIRGGEITHVPLSLSSASEIAISPDGAKLLIGEPSWYNQESNVWFFSTSGKSLQKLGGGVNIPFAWAPGKKIVYARGTEIWTTDEDGAHPARLLNASSRVALMGWSPDAKRIWYTTFRPGGSPISIGEIDANTGRQRRVFEENGTGAEFCCGFWSASEASFGFMSHSGHLMTLVVAPDSWSWFHRSRANSRAVLGLPQVSDFAPDSARNRFLVAAGGPWHGDVARFDRATGQFTPYFDGISARDIDFAPDGKSAVFVDGYDHTLWRYDLENHLKTRLTNPPFIAQIPRWSPDGRWIALSGSGPEGRWRIYRLPAQGGAPERLIPNDDNEGAPTWSRDGKSLIFGKVDCEFSGQCGVYRYDLAARSLRMLPGSQGFRTARWSPDGKYVAALRPADHGVMLFDFARQQWRKLYGPVLGDELCWSHDAKYVYGYNYTGADPFIFRVAVPTGTFERVSSSKGLAGSQMASLTWFGLGPDDSPLISRETGEDELFVVNYQMP